MTTLDAYDRFTSVDRDQPMLVENNGRVIDGWPAMMVAAVRLLDWLDDSVNEADLMDAVDHFLTCVTMNVFTLQQWQEETKAVLREVEAEQVRLMEVWE